LKLIPAARVLVAFVPLLAAGCATGPRQGWQKVGGPLQNVSGMAFVGADGSSESQPVEFLVVHDNKQPDEPHVASVLFGYATGVSYRRLAWPENVPPPVDLEAICPLPETPGSFLALTSAGRLLHLRYHGRRAAEALEVLHESILPGLEQHPNLEGVAVQTLGDKTVALWAERGDGHKPATLYWGIYDAVADTVTPQGKAQVAVPYPSGRNTRHITDLRLDGGGVVWGAAASDPGDQGPFESAVYALGSLHLEGDRIVFQPNHAPTRLWTARRKIEAIEFVPGAAGRVYFGSDDESAGGWLNVGRGPARQ